MKKALISVLYFVSVCIAAASPSVINSEVFDAVINEAAKFHYDGKFRQKHAETIKKFRQKAVKSVNFEELGRVLNEFLRQLPDSHFAVITPSYSSKQAVCMLENDAKLLESDGKVLVYECGDDSVFKCGDELLSVNGQPPDFNARIGAALQLYNKLTFGVPGREMKIGIVRDGRQMTVKYIAEQRKTVPALFKLGEMPSMPESYISKKIDDNIGYICFGLFVPNAVQMLKKDIAGKFKNVPKLVIDLRNNNGGLIFMGVSMASFLSGKKVDFGKMTIGGETLGPKSYPQKNRYRGRVFILVDRNSYSTAEVFACAMYESGAAVVLGERTAGMCLPSGFIALPHGFRLQTVVGDYVSASGKRLEGVGFTPYEIIRNTPETLKNNRDMLIEYVKNL